MANVYRITDSAGKSCEISSTANRIIPGAVLHWDEQLNSVADWFASQFGWLKYTKGISKLASNPWVTLDFDYLLFGDYGSWGIRLYNVQRFTPLAFWFMDKGEGILLQPWGLQMKPGAITWQLVA